MSRNPVLPAASPLPLALRLREGPFTRDLALVSGGADLGKVPARLAPEATSTTVCGFCSTGCGLTVHLRNNEAVNLSPNPAYPVNLGMACPKGWESLTPLRASDRALTPLLRDGQGQMQAVDWDTALQTFCNRFQAIQAQHGKHAVAFLGSGQIVTEELAFLGALAKFGMGMRHGDANTRQCMATAATAYKESFGFDAPPFTYDDFEQSDVIVLIGSNLCIAHPIMWQRILRNPHRPAIIVIDPRRTETAAAATQHIALRPKSDLALLNGLARRFIERGWIDRQFISRSTSGFEALAQHLEGIEEAQVLQATGISQETFENLCRTIHQGKRVSFWWTMGVNQSHEATRTAQAIINLALLTGNIGRPGTGANSITGQCNAMGSRLFSNTTGLIGGHSFGDPAHRHKVADILQIDEATIPPDAGLAYDQILRGIDAGEIKGLWVIGTNAAHSWIDQDDLQRVLGKLDFLVVQDMYTSTETAQRADLLLPAAGWGEKQGTFINSERRISVAKKVARAPGQALADFHIFQLLAAAWGCGEMFAAWSSPERVFTILQELTAGQPCDIRGIRDYHMLDQAGGIQWPFPSPNSTTDYRRPTTDYAESTAEPESEAILPTHRRLFEDGRFYHPDGRARFIAATPTPLPEAPCDEYPLLLLTGRASAAQWHTGTRTDKSPVLRQLSPRELLLEIHPDDAQRLGIKTGERVAITSRRATIHACALLTATIQPGQVFLPMHDKQTNRLTLPVVDPFSRQPAYKACAVSVVRR